VRNATRSCWQNQREKRQKDATSTAAKFTPYHALSQLKNLLLTANAPALRAFLAGRFIIDLGDVKKKELLETPEAMVIRLGL